MDGRTLLISLATACLSTTALAAPYDFDGTWVEVDEWYGSGANESIIVIDWNETNGPYATEAHAWGYRWDGPTTIKDALLVIEASSTLTVEYAFGGGFVNNAWYDDGVDHHATDGYAGWVWVGSTADGGDTLVLNGGGVHVEPLEHHVIEAINWNPGDWTGANFTIPAPEPATSLMLTFPAVIVLLRVRRK